MKYPIWRTFVKRLSRRGLVKIPGNAVIPRRSESGTAGAASLRQSAARRISQTMSAAVRSQIATITAAAIFPTRVALPTISSDF